MENVIGETVFVKDTQYEVVELIGEGAFGTTFLLDGGTYGMICMKAIISDDDDPYELNPEEEAEIHKRLSGHTNIVSYISHRTNQESNRFELFLEYVNNDQLGKHIERGLTTSQSVNYFRQLIDGLAFIHSKGICHKDIHPENILLTENFVVKICDFGFSEEFTKGDDLLEEYGGNSIYKPPETFEGNGYDGHLMDLWGASIVFVEMLTGDRPWKKRPDDDCEEFVNWTKNNFDIEPWVRISKIGSTLLDLFKRMLHREQDTRPTISEIIDWLNANPDIWIRTFFIRQYSGSLTLPIFYFYNPEERRLIRTQIMCELDRKEGELDQQKNISTSSFNWP